METFEELTEDYIKKLKFDTFSIDSIIFKKISQFLTKENNDKIGLSSIIYNSCTSIILDGTDFYVD